jgi:predicted Zn-dependent protease
MGDLQQALKKISLPYSDGLYDRQSQLLIVKNKERETIRSSSIQGISFRAFTQNGWAYSESNKTDLPTIRKLAQSFSEKRSGSKGKARLFLPDPIKFDVKTPVAKETGEIALEDKLQRIREFYSLARGIDSRVLDVRVSYSEIGLERALVSSHGTFARQNIPRTRITMQVIVKENGVTDYDTLSIGGTMGYEVVGNLTEEMVKETVEGALVQLKAVTPPAGRQSVIIDPGTVGTLCHESSAMVWRLIRL